MPSITATKTQEISNVIELRPKVRPPEYSDDALALRFADQHAPSLRYVADLRQWLIWNGMHWKFDNTGMTRELVRQVCRVVARECNEPKVSKAIASLKTINAVERLAQADRRIAATVDQFDADPWQLNTPNGIVDLKTGEIGPHRPNAYHTKLTAVGPDKNCQIPQWDKLLHESMAGDVDVIEYLQLVAGYALTGSVEEHQLWFWYGDGGNGKGVQLNTIRDCLGDYGLSAPIETFIASDRDRHPTELARLRGARLVTCSETEQGRRWAESRVKMLTGGDRVSARFMNKDFFEFMPQFKLIIAGNHKPSLRSVDAAIRRRFNLVPFTVTVPEEKRDTKLPEKLKREWPGILHWMIGGCIEWQRRKGLAQPRVVAEATDKYLRDEDTVEAWLQDAGTRDPNAWEPSAALYASWTSWATKAGEFVGDQKTFAAKMEKHGIESARRSGARGYRGLRLKPTGYEEE